MPARRFVPVAVDEQDDLAFGHGLYAIQIQIGEFFVHAALRLLPFALNAMASPREAETARNSVTPPVPVNGLVSTRRTSRSGTGTPGSVLPEASFSYSAKATSRKPCEATPAAPAAQGYCPACWQWRRPAPKSWEHRQKFARGPAPCAVATDEPLHRERFQPGIGIKLADKRHIVVAQDHGHAPLRRGGRLGARSICS